MKNLINLINDINHYGLKIDSVTSNVKNVSVFLMYKKENGLISSHINLNKYNNNEFLDWYRLEERHKTKEGWNSHNYDLTNSFNYFLNLIQKIKIKKGITDEQITDKLDLLIIDKRRISFQYSHYDDFEVIEFYITGATKEPWKEINSQNYSRLIEWIIKRSKW